jgi:hypothetical protein
MNTKNLDAAIRAVAAEQGAEVAPEDLDAYLAKVAELTAACHALKAPHAKAIRNAASRASRERRAERIKAGLALLAEQEAASKK